MIRNGRQELADENKTDETDGRARRSVRSRERILDALAELIVEGNLQPTGQQVAARASVALRTVFRHFDDMEGLYREMDARLRESLRPIAESPIPEGSLDDRIRALVHRRGAAFEKAAPFMRSGALGRWRSLYLSEAHDTEVRQLRKDLSWGLPEIDALSTPKQEALDVATSFEVWDRLRKDQKLGRARAEEVIVEIICALFERDRA
jgi:AcrR family transcriptional regulator